jgi:hypothetical protein
MASLWEKCSLYAIRIDILDTELSFPLERDCWLMQPFVELGYSMAALVILNRVWLYQQVLFLSCVLNASGRDLDVKYLYPRPEGQQWSVLKFPKEKLTPSEFKLWLEALRQLVPAGGVAVCLGRSLHKGYKVWDWRVCIDEELLLKYKLASMDVYQLAPNSRRRWQQSQENASVELLGRDGQLVTTSVAPALDEVIKPTTVLEVIHGWKQGWFRKKFEIIGHVEWLVEAIEAGSVLAVADGSYIRELFSGVSSCAFVFECQEGRGRILGKRVEGSDDACAYRGELLGLLAIHLILLVINKLRPDLVGRIRMVRIALEP